jgi:hypothetical protein
VHACKKPQTGCCLPPAASAAFLRFFAMPTGSIEGFRLCSIHAAVWFEKKQQLVALNGSLVKLSARMTLRQVLCTFSSNSGGSSL